MLAVINSLETKLPELQAALVQAGDDAQQKMMLVVPVLQNALATPMSQFGFPPGPAGLMQGMMAFQLITSSCLPGSADHAVLTQGVRREHIDACWFSGWRCPPRPPEC